MAKDYYSQPTSTSKHQTIVREIMRRIRLYVLDILYTTEHYNNAKKRFVLADIGAGSDAMIKGAVKSFQKTTQNFPFTAYNNPDVERRDEGKSLRASSGRVFSEELGCYIASFPCEFEVPMISFYADVSDYYHARYRLMEQNKDLIRLKVPIVINSVETYFPIDIEYEITKGDYPHEFEEYLNKNKIYDISHTFNIKYYHFIVYKDKYVDLFYKDNVLDIISDPPTSPAPSTGDRYIVAPTGTGAWDGHDNQIAEWSGTAWVFSTPQHNWAVINETDNFVYAYNENTNEWVKLPLSIAPVDNMYLRLWQLDQDDQGVNMEQYPINESPKVLSTNPVNKATDVDKTGNIQITFSQSMNPESVIDALDIFPFISADFSWDSTDKILTINPRDDLNAETKYTIEVAKEALGHYPLMELENEYEFSFTTGV